MATNKELLEAAAFHRRRLVAALLSGSPYDEPPRLLRAVAAGVLLALVAVAVALVAGYLGSPP
ncbi:type VII secretion protein EccB [Nocardioides pelophilus]|uniref:type VII secretion protein EccB n=1 Tax=Nocardioides pelophilus TaxID=2172019 RepID=UPI00160295C6|nr:type VII secretion protein EccB [Nocardioides pelophilus]